MELFLVLMISLLIGAMGLGGMAIGWLVCLPLLEQRLNDLPLAPPDRSNQQLAYAAELLKDAKLNAGMNLKAEIEQFLESYERD